MMMPLMAKYEPPGSHRLLSEKTNALRNDVKAPTEAGGSECVVVCVGVGGGVMVTVSEN